MHKINNTPPKDILSVIPKDEKIIWYGKPDIRRFCLTALGLKYIFIYLIIIFCVCVFCFCGCVFKHVWFWRAVKVLEPMFGVRSSTNNKSVTI